MMWADEECEHIRRWTALVRLQLLLIKRLRWYSIYARDFPAQQVWIRANVLVEVEIGPETGQNRNLPPGGESVSHLRWDNLIETRLNLDPEVVSTFLNLLVFLVVSSVVADVINLRSYCPGCGRCVQPGHSSSNRTPEYEPRSFSAVCVGTHSASLSLCNKLYLHNVQHHGGRAGISVPAAGLFCPHRLQKPHVGTVGVTCLFPWPRNGGTDLNRGQPTCPSFCSHISVDSAPSAFSADITHPRSSSCSQELFT